MQTTPAPATRQTSILLVDDDRSSLTAVAAVLESLQQQVVTATSGQEALRHLLEQDFAVIVLDVQMPVLNGLETAALIRERERSRHIPIIFLTGVMNASETMFEGYSNGAVDYLTKPIEPSVLTAKVSIFVELALARQKLQAEVEERARANAEILKLNRALEQKNAELLAVNADLEAFAYSVSHDLRAPLRYIDTYLNLLTESAAAKLNEEESGFVRSACNAAKRLSRLIDDLLEFSRIGRAQMRLSTASMDVPFNDALIELQSETKNRKINWRIAPLPQVVGDPNLLRQVWVNLLRNALKYTRDRETVEIAVGSELQGEEIVFHIRDNGIGFNMKYANDLFGVFARLHNARDFEGTGVGLANVRRIIVRHGGRTWATGVEGEGATFYFSLPRRATVATDSAAD